MKEHLYRDLSFALKRDILKNNNVGAVSSTTVILCNTKCWHGLLSVYNPKTKEQKVLLSCLDDAIVVNNKVLYLSTRKYPDVYFPLGHQYIKSATFNPITTIEYGTSKVNLTKEMLIASNEETLLLRYTITKADQPVKLQIRPIVAFRDALQLIRMDRSIITGNTPIHNGIAYHPRKDEDMIFMQTSRPCEFVTAPDWNYNIEYPQDFAEGRPYQEDLFMPGFFEVELNEGDDIYFSASTKNQNPDTLADFFKSETLTRTKRKSYDEFLQFSASQMFREVDNECQLLEKIPARNYFSYHLLAALPGLTLPSGNYSLFLKVAKSYIKKMKNNAFGDPEQQNYDPESPFWLVWAVQQYGYQVGNLKEVYKTFGSTLCEIVRAGMNNAIPGLTTNVNGLIAMERSHRMRYFVDVNALWYNALMYVSELSIFNGDSNFSNLTNLFARKLKLAFSTRFVDRSINYLADSINDDGDKDLVCRPGQILAYALPYTIADIDKSKEALKVMEEKLLTKWGLRKCPLEYGSYNLDGEGDIYPIYLGFLAELYLKLDGEDEGMKKAEAIYNTFNDADRIAVESPNFYERFNPQEPCYGKGSPLFAGTIAAINRIKLLMDQF